MLGLYRDWRRGAEREPLHDWVEAGEREWRCSKSKQKELRAWF